MINYNAFRGCGCEVHKNACRCKESACINCESAEAVRVFAGVLKYQWRSCVREAMKVPASRGCKSANKGRESACIALSAIRGLEIAGESVFFFDVRFFGN